MGLGRCMLSVMVVMLITGVQSAIKGLTATCTPSDTCLHPYGLQLTCDVLHKVCLLKVNQDCGRDGREGLCVTGAACTGRSNTRCACGPGYTESDGRCNGVENTYGGSCKADGSCDAAGLMCHSATGLCTCNNDYKPNLQDGTCVALSAGKVGKVCSGLVDTENCDSLKCSDGICICQTGFYGSTVGSSCEEVPDTKFHKNCTTENEPMDCGMPSETFLRCIDSFCTCLPGYTGIPGGICVPNPLKVGGSCNTTCDDSNAECSNYVCTCQEGYTADTRKLTCLPNNNDNNSNIPGHNKAGTVAVSLLMMATAILTVLSIHA